MKLHFQDQTFSFELLRAASYAIDAGASIGECLATAALIHEGDFEAWHLEWHRLAQRVTRRGELALTAGHRISAREAFLRASNYFRTAEFFLAPDDPRRLPTYEKSRAAFRQACALMVTPVASVMIPYGGKTLPGYFFTVDDSAVARPTILALGGFDSTGEELYFFAAAAALRRGYNCLAFDGPGQGEPLRMQQMAARADYEVPVKAAVDYLVARPEVDAGKLAIWGTSLGGYYAARAAAFEPRLKACVVHGAMFDLWDAQAAKQPLLFMLAKRWPGLLNHDAIFDLPARLNPGLRWASSNGMWVFNVRSRRELLATLPLYSLKKVAGQITCPTFIAHGEEDHFIPPQQATDLFAALHCPKTLRMFTAAEGGGEHCQMGNLSLLHQVALDWLDDVFKRSEPDSRAQNAFHGGAAER